MEANFEIVEKEQLSNLIFPKHEVLTKEEEINQRFSDLSRALVLGNIEHSKIKIYFEDGNSKKVVETTVWGLTDERVILKQGIGIPINRIYKSA